MADLDGHRTAVVLLCYTGDVKTSGPVDGNLQQQRLLSRWDMLVSLLVTLDSWKKAEFVDTVVFA